MRGRWFTVALVAVACTSAATAAAHYDHPAPSFTPSDEPASTVFNAGGENAEWELLATIQTGNAHSDLDFFTHKGETYASVGTLGTGPNAGGQTIVRLTEGGEVKPAVVGSHPSASCPTGSSSVTGLQHDVEATPKGATVLPNAPNRFADRRDAQLLLDSTDAPGRCHDQGALGVSQSGTVPQGGIEIIDVTDPAAPKEIGLVSHVGQAHTVNVDPKRPHIAFDVTQDSVTIAQDGSRSNESGGNAMDGFEVLDLSSCMNFPPGTTLEAKRAACRPQVYRYRYPEVAIAKAHSFNTMQSCHEVEIYADDTLTCASITATAVFDLSGAFDDRGTPDDYTDDKPRGTPLPCTVRESSTQSAPFRTAAMITDCAAGLTVSDWLKAGAPALEGVRWKGSVPHMGFGATADIVNTPYDATEDIVAAHESELTESGRFVITSDERGGGVVPGGATCSPGADNARGNGGLHVFPIGSFTTTPPTTAEDSWKLWAKTSKGERAIWRANIRTGPQGSFCTAHVFQLIPGQNRMFMGWYSQGTQVLDLVENADGTIDFREAGWFTPEAANTWVSGIFKVQRNPDGTFTYFGATGDGILPGTGRGAVDVYKVTLPAPPEPRGGPRPGSPPPSTPSGPEPACAQASGFDRAGVRPRGRGLLFSFARRGGVTATVDLLRGKRRVKRFAGRTRSFRYRGAGLRRGIYVARFRTRAPDGRADVRRVAVRRTRGRWRSLPAFETRRPCGLVDAFALRGPTFGKRLKLRFRLGESARVKITVRRGGRVVARRKPRMYAADRTHRIALRPRGRRGVYRVLLEATRPGRSSDLVLRARRR